MALNRIETDVVVVGGGAAGVAAAMAAAGRGSSVVLLERGTSLGGELIGGLPILSVANARGEWIVGGVGRRLLEAAEEMDGYAGLLFDGRAMWGACVDPEVMKLVVIQALAERGVRVLMGCGVVDVVAAGGQVTAVVAQAKSGPVLVEGKVFVDASGDADLAAYGGVPTMQGDDSGTLQPVSLTFRMSHVDFGGFLEWFRANPEQFNLGENPAFGMTPSECAEAVYRTGKPFCVLQGQGGETILARAIAEGEMFPTTAVWMWPTSMGRQEMGFNTTRIAGIDGTDSEAIARAAAELAGQVRQATSFLQRRLPGFEAARLSGVAPKVGVRETRRVRGEETLRTEDVVEGRKRPDGVARGAHHVDIHGSGTDQVRRYVRDGRSYDIPYGALIPVGPTNLLVAGRCLSSEREANGSARVMGTCLAMGQAAGTAAAMAADAGTEAGAVDVSALREALQSDGAVVDGPE